ncbi:hypothetical protein [Chondromyces apiculatus]|uniref:Uncharacterized protein n=1 Tax=Chondromyces apiculatus DSM 436 TaxID=1192034 RepID=A0A017TF32_9BACT|nr:hypothetical protein [Chondromyces apiculatus]EYF07206.1 Hypothetical protein CAP_0685 [Chondromyces apiculatus DSM 436]
MPLRTLRVGALATLAALIAASLLGCGGASQTKPAGTAAAATAKPASLTCPSLEGDAAFDFAGAFGVDQAMSARLTRMVRLVSELERTATALDTETRATCSALATDLGATPQELSGAPAASSSADAPHPCVIAANHLATLRQTLGTAQLSVSVSDVSCTLPRDAVATCAGECLTGQTGVTSAVDCALTDASCRLDFSLPDASPQCATQCAVRALRDVRCSAQVDVRLGTTTDPGSGGSNAPTSDPRFTAIAEGLRRDIPRLAGLGASIGPRSIQLGKDVAGLVDDLASTITALTDSKTSTARRIVIGAVLAECLGPQLANAIRSSTSLEATLSQAISLHGALTKR